MFSWYKLTNTSTTYSSFDKIPELNILQKAFVFSNNLRTMAVSTTTHGITPKQLLGNETLSTSKLLTFVKLAWKLVKSLRYLNHSSILDARLKPSTFPSTVKKVSFLTTIPFCHLQRAISITIKRLVN